MRVIYLIIIIGDIALFFLGCKNKMGSGSIRSASSKDVYYSVPKAPSVISGEIDLSKYYAENFWRDFDFSDSTQVSLCDSAYFRRLMSEWVFFLKNVPEIGPSCVEKVMVRAQICNYTFNRFVSVLMEILSEPNSPIRDDELYMPVLKAQIGNPFIDDANKERCQYRLKLLEQNRMGHKANNFEYTLANGHKGTLYNLKAEYTLLFINDPTCDNCRAIKNDISDSKIMSSLVGAGRLIILAIYPYEDIDEWFRYQDEIPKTWINAYDKECIMHSRSLYNLSAIPALYLLDSNKTVLIKDSNDITEIERILSECINK